ncbi:hypothetical protein [Streptomyces sp. NPDC050738]|uniref:hypothetical protein n=1 Tax=Streptomyces sp. NPDC050738 TaxID=3154744 RepID=UPI00342C3F16
MDTLTPPSPEPRPYGDVAAQPVPEVPLLPAGPLCGLCGADAVAVWQRRLTGEELTQQVEWERERRARAVELSDPQLPAPVFGPLPGPEDFVRPVYACGPHAITLDLATLVHQASCSAPAVADLPGCSCTPEALLTAAAAPVLSSTAALPDHWVVGGE